MLSSKISVHRHFLSLAFLFSSWVCPPTFIAAIPAVKLDMDDEEANGSTSTTLTTAFPSRTFRTLSTSQFLVAVTDGDEDDEDVCVCEGVVWPLNASQNAPPNFLNRVWPASTASAALCSRCSRSFSFSLNRSTSRSDVVPLRARLGEPGGVGRPLYDEYELDPNVVCFPDKSAESVECEGPGVEGGVG